MTTKEWREWLLARVTHSSIPLVSGARYRITVAPIKHDPTRRFDIVGTFSRALTQLVFVDDDGRERRVNSATIIDIEELP